MKEETVKSTWKRLDQLVKGDRVVLHDGTPRPVRELIGEGGKTTIVTAASRVTWKNSATVLTVR